MEVVNELLGVPGLKIIQDSEMFSFSIDSVILADFATINKSTKKIVDLGTGNAPIPLYLTLRTKNEIIGIEIQEKSYQLAQKSVKINNKEHQIKIFNDNLIGINKKIGQGIFDLVICNPPFFKYQESSNVNKNDFLTIARHEVLVNLDQICNEAKLLLNNNGYFAMVHRPDRLADIIVTMKKYGLEPKRIRMVYPRVGSQANHVLIEARKTKVENGIKVLQPLYLHSKGDKYTKEVLNIFNAKEE